MTEKRTRWNSTIPVGDPKPLVRRSALPRGGPPKKKRTVKRFAKLRLPHYKAWIKEQACCITGRYTGEYIGGIRVHVDPAHIVAKSLGGPDKANMVPLARHLHDQLDLALKRRLFEQKHRVNLVALAEAYWGGYLDEFPERAEAGT